MPWVEGEEPPSTGARRSNASTLKRQIRLARSEALARVEDAHRLPSFRELKAQGKANRDEEDDLPF
jgi:hypothetical protein